LPHGPVAGQRGIGRGEGSLDFPPCVVQNRPAATPTVRRIRLADHTGSLAFSDYRSGTEWIIAGVHVPAVLRHTAVTGKVQDMAVTVAAGSARGLLQRGIQATAESVATADGSALGDELINVRESITQLEAIFAEGLGRFDKAGDYQADGALSSVAWLKWKCKLSGGAAAERVGIARNIEELPRTQEAFARGDVGYQHVAALARTAENVGAAPVRQHEATLLQAAQTMDPGRFASVAKDFEQRVDAAALLAEANRAYARRYLHLSEPSNGLVRLDGLLDAEGGALVRSALNAVISRDKDDERTAGQRMHDALVDLSKRAMDTGKLPERGGQRPHLIITTTVDGLAGVPGKPAGQLLGAAAVPAETLRRQACDAAITRITGAAELDAEVTKASRTIPSGLRRVLIARDRGCVFPSCGRPPEWTDAHHLRHWTDGGATRLENLALLCRRHHRHVHEGGWRLQHGKDGNWVAIAPPTRLQDLARSA
jgi:hypothetical protein